MQEQDQKDVHKLQNGRPLGISYSLKKIFDNNSNINNNSF